MVNSTEVRSYLSDDTDAYVPFFLGRDWLPYVLRSISQLVENCRRLVVVAPVVTDAYGTLLASLNDELDPAKVTVTLYADFVPSPLLPTFNDNTVYAYLPYIRNLSDNFILIKPFTFLTPNLKLNPKTVPVLSRRLTAQEAHLKGHDAALSAQTTRSLKTLNLQFQEKEDNSDDVQLYKFKNEKDTAKKPDAETANIADLRGPLAINKRELMAALDSQSTLLEKTTIKKYSLNSSLGLILFYCIYMAFAF